MGTGGAIQLVELAKIRDAIQRRTRAAVAPGARLHILTVGVGDYGKLATHVRLEYADDDARDIASALAATQAGLYAAVPVQTLLNEEATKAGILRGLSTMRQAMERGEGRDLAVVHFSGHGAMVDGTFHLLTHEVDARDDVAIKGTALPVQTLQSEIEQLAKHGRVLLLLDACRSGATTGDGRSVAVDADALRASLRGPNITILTSSTADELSREDSVWGNGAFTEAFLDALTERADGDGNGLISTDELMRHVVEVVGRITGGAQTPGVDLRFGSSLFAAGIGESSPSP
jgi:uncharacterized caspase-like protein